MLLGFQNSMVLAGFASSMNHGQAIIGGKLRQDIHIIFNIAY
jgi:hypothetical protein